MTAFGRTGMAATSVLLLAGSAHSQTGSGTAADPYRLKPTPKSVAWGYYDATTPPVLRIKSGDVVEVQTLITSSPARLETSLVGIFQLVVRKDKHLRWPRAETRPTSSPWACTRTSSRPPAWRFGR